MRWNSNYKDHAVSVDTIENVSKDGFIWSYTIDGLHLTTGRKHFGSGGEAHVLQIGLVAARKRIDGWTPLTL